MTNNIEFISVNEIYRIAREEMEENNSHGMATRAIAQAHGDKKIAKNLFVKFQYEELSSKEDWERAERKRKKREQKRLGVADIQWRNQMELERKEIEQAAARRQLKWQRKFEFGCSKRKFDALARWGMGLGTIVGIFIGIVWFFVYQDLSPAHFLNAGNASSITMTENSYDPANKIAEYRKAAEHGDIKAQIHLGKAYKEGYGIAKDETQAVLWFRKAAEQGNPLAQETLGYLYANGNGVTQDQAQAVIWYLKAAEQNNANAQFNLAVAYKNGIGLPKNDVEAMKWFGKAANLGDAEAQTILGKIYEHGLLGVRKNESLAEAWYQKAAEQGNQDALDALINLEAWLRD